MKITNKLRLPEPIVQACVKDYKPTSGRYGVTSLLKGTTQVTLERRYNDEIVQDASQMIWALFGQGVHAVLEKADIAGTLKEHRMECATEGGTVSGICDLYNERTGTVTDYKTTTVWKVIKGDWTDYRKQLLHYAWMLEEHGYPCRSGEIVAILKDHSKTKAKVDRDYPPYPIHVQRFKFSENELKEAKAEAISKLKELREAETVADDDLPPCLPEERWNDGDKFAVMSKGKKRALRVLSSEEEAKQWMESTGKGSFIEERPGADKRCEEYCSVSQYCPYWRRKSEKADNRQA